MQCVDKYKESDLEVYNTKLFPLIEWIKRNIIKDLYNFLKVGSKSSRCMKTEDNNETFKEKK